jgi:hypothetical protein
MDWLQGTSAGSSPVWTCSLPRGIVASHAAYWPVPGGISLGTLTPRVRSAVLKLGPVVSVRDAR